MKGRIESIGKPQGKEELRCVQPTDSIFSKRIYSKRRWLFWKPASGFKLFPGENKVAYLQIRELHYLSDAGIDHIKTPDCCLLPLNHHTRFHNPPCPHEKIKKYKLGYLEKWREHDIGSVVKESFTTALEAKPSRMFEHSQDIDITLGLRQAKE